MPDEPSWKKFENFEGPTEEEQARAEKRALNHAHHAARRNRNLMRELATPDSAGVWGISSHHKAGKNWQ